MYGGVVLCVAVFCLAKRRREAWDFPGGAVLRTQLQEKPSRRRVGFVSTGPVARGTYFGHSCYLPYWLYCL